MRKWLTRLVSPPSFSETLDEARAYIKSELEKMGWRLTIDREIELNHRVQRKFGLSEERVAELTHEVVHQHHD